MGGPGAFHRGEAHLRRPQGLGFSSDGNSKGAMEKDCELGSGSKLLKSKIYMASGSLGLERPVGPISEEGS